MNSQADKLNHLSGIVALIAKIYTSKSGELSETEKQLLAYSQAACKPEEGLKFDQALTRLHDVIWQASQAYKDRPADSLSEDEKQLLTELQADGFLTKDPGGVDTDFGFGFQPTLQDSVDPNDKFFIDDEQAKRLAGASWHSLNRVQTTEAIVLQAMGLLAPHVRQIGADHGHVRCEVGAYVGSH